MRNIIKILGSFGALTILFAIGYFLLLYTNLTQLIISLGIAGLLILAAFLYIYNWIQNKDVESDERDHAIDMTRDYIREVEENKK